MLAQYLTQTARLLQNPGAPTTLYSTGDLTSYINTARGQLAGEAECVRRIGSLAVTAGVNTYDFSAITLAPSTGIKSVLNLRTVWFVQGTGQTWIKPRPYEWFSIYDVNGATLTDDVGVPATWSQYGQGASGSLYIAPYPDFAYTLKTDTVTLPIDLVDDATVEAIPFPWTDAVPFFAAYYALLGSQTQARSADAERMFQRYEEFKNRARQMSNPSVLPYSYPQTVDPATINKLALPQRGQGG